MLKGNRKVHMEYSNFILVKKSRCKCIFLKIIINVLYDVSQKELFVSSVKPPPSRNVTKSCSQQNVHRSDSNRSQRRSRLAIYIQNCIFTHKFCLRMRTMWIRVPKSSTTISAGIYLIICIGTQFIRYAIRPFLTCYTAVQSRVQYGTFPI